MSQRDSNKPLMGRSQEFTYLEAWLRTALTIKKGIFDLSGPAGMGKGALLQEVSSKLNPNLPPLVLQCGHDQQKPYQIFSQWLQRRFLGHNALRYRDPFQAFNSNFSRLLASLPGRKRQDLESSVACLSWLAGLPASDDLSRLDPKTRYELASAALRTLLKAEADLFPLVVIVKNAHLIDYESARFLAGMHENGLILLLSRRTDAATPGNAKLLVDKADDRLIMGPLDMDQTHALVRHLVDLQENPLILNDSVIATIYQATDGLPYLVEQMVSLLHQNMLSASVKTDFCYGKDPGSRDVLQNRIRALYPARRHVLQAAAVLGMRFNQDTLAALVQGQYGLNQEQCRSALDFGLTERFWHLSGEKEYMFNELLLKEACEASLPRNELEQLHLACAKLLQEHYAENADFYAHDIAFHFERCGSPHAARWYETAATVARKEYRNRQAIEYYDKALSLGNQLPGDERLELLRKKAESAEQAKELSIAESSYRQLLEESRQALNAYEESWALSGLGNLAELRSNRELAMELLQQALELAGRSGNTDAAMQTWGRIGMVLDSKEDWNGAREAYQKKLVMARTAGNKAAITSSLNNIALVYLGEHNFGEAITILRQLSEQLQAGGDPVVLSKVYGNLAYAYDEKGNINEALRCYKLQLELAGKYGYRLGVSIALCGLGSNALKLGQTSEAAIRLAEAVAIGQEIGIKYYSCEYQYFYALALRQQGNNAKALQAVQQAWADAQADERADILARSEPLVLELRYALTGEPADKQALLRQLFTLASAEGDRQRQAFASLGLFRIARIGAAVPDTSVMEACRENFADLYMDTGRDEYARILNELKIAAPGQAG